MNLHLAEAGRTLIPRKDDEYGLLSPAMVLMTFIAGLVDALSYLALGHVFVANVTGNIVFLGFALAHAQGFVWWTSARHWCASPSARSSEAASYAGSENTGPAIC